MTNTENMNMLLGANIELLKTDLNLLFNKTDGVNRFLLLPTNIEADNSVTFGEMLADFKKAFNMDGGEDISGTIGELSGKDGKGIDLNKLIIKLNQAFLYIENNDQGTSAEYAISVTVDATEALPDMGFARIKSLSLAVWNTKRANVLKTLNIGAFDKLLPA